MIQAPQVNVEYDRKFDILYLIVGEPTAAEAEFLVDGIYIRREAFTERIAGAIIENYSGKNVKCLSEILPGNLGMHLPVMS